MSNNDREWISGPPRWRGFNEESRREADRQQRARLKAHAKGSAEIMAEVVEGIVDELESVPSFGVKPKSASSPAQHLAAGILAQVGVLPEADPEPPSYRWDDYPDEYEDDDEDDDPSGLVPAPPMPWEVR